VGAGVEADLVAAGVQHRGDHRARAAFALGSGDVNGAEFFLGVAELAKEGSHALEVEGIVVITDDAEALDVAKGGKEAQRLGVAVNGRAVGGPMAICRRGMFFDGDENGLTDGRRVPPGLFGRRSRFMGCS
jgi:hypothetical protein